MLNEIQNLKELKLRQEALENKIIEAIPGAGFEQSQRGLEEIDDSDLRRRFILGMFAISGNLPQYRFVYSNTTDRELKRAALEGYISLIKVFEEYQWAEKKIVRGDVDLREKNFEKGTQAMRTTLNARSLYNRIESDEDRKRVLEASLDMAANSTQCVSLYSMVRPLRGSVDTDFAIKVLKKSLQLAESGTNDFSKTLTDVECEEKFREIFEMAIELAENFYQLRHLRKKIGSYSRSNNSLPDWRKELLSKIEEKLEALEQSIVLSTPDEAP